MAVVTFDASSLCNSGTGFVGSASSTSWSHTTGSHSNLILVVSVQTDTHPAAPTVSSITYNSVNLTKAGQITGPANGTNGECNAEIWYLVAPATGAHTVAVTLSATATDLFACAMTFYNVNQSSPTGTAATTNNGNANATPMTVTVSSTNTSQIVVDSIAENSGTLTVGASQTQINNNIGSQIRGAASYKTGTASTTTMSWTPGTTNTYAMVGVALNVSALRIMDGFGGVFS